MATRPTDGFPTFAENDVTLPDGTNNKVPLRSNIESEGYTVNDQPPVQEFNYILDKIARWVEYLDEAVGDVNQGSFPIDSYYFSAVSTDPATTLGFGTWVREGEGRFISSVGTGTDDNAVSRQMVAGDNSGEYEVILTQQQMPRHSHTYTLENTRGSGAAGAEDGNSSFTTPNTSEAGNDQAHSNTPPSFGMYVWRRTA